VIFQGILVLCFLGIFAYSLSQWRRSRLVGGVITTIAVAGIVMVLLPDLTNIAAHAVGVGRGADLILYCFIVVTLVAVLNLHLRIRAMSEQNTEIVRLIALSSVQDNAPPHTETNRPATLRD
jgi:hypothetical protein